MMSMRRLTYRFRHRGAPRRTVIRPAGRGEEPLTDSRDLRRENEALCERISTLTAAILRISATLALDTVLAEVVASPRGLTGARYGAIVTDESGAPQDFVFSGVTPEEQQELLAWLGSGRLLQHLRELRGPLRLADLADLPGHADAPPRRRRRQLLPRREGRRQRVHRRRRRGAGAVRVAGRGGDRQRPHAPRRAAGGGRPRGPGRDLAGRRRGLRPAERPAGIAQPRGEDGSSRACGPPAVRPSNSWKRSPSAAPTGGRCR